MLASSGISVETKKGRLCVKILWISKIVWFGDGIFCKFEQCPKCLTGQFQTEPITAVFST